MNMFRKGKSIWFDRWLLLQLLFITNLPEKIITGSESSEFIDSNIMVNDGQSIDKHEQTRMAECHLRPVIHILQRAGCIPKPIPSFACYGTCNSYVQVSFTSLIFSSSFIISFSLSIIFKGFRF